MERIVPSMPQNQMGCHNARVVERRNRCFEEYSKTRKELAYFGGLLESHQQASDASYAETLDRWNSGADNIGILLNLATAIL
ncbi:hypothetical protein CORC01_12457 [Colletotrichum orchidophilum]|uniref:Uncharacterized protein n=1 Tax=Colletotrichum orchidophilum TaxID=1209926 RepID=A0A1G4ASZ0_9PEZI|nr:uncharacterized protein CORC01_12457 [Colletotrichum orchidophilum]OHE92221.1 hypothetical protein CORC01_12457 [Colletotrichum orchidophilum]